MDSAAFTGFTEAALDLYDDLELENTRSFWEANQQVWAESVRAPMTALVTALEQEFGSAKVFRPYRDVRFSKDRTPYKTHQGAFVAAAPACGWYVEISARGVRTAAGFYDASADGLARFRAAVDNRATGRQLASIVAALADAGFEIGGQRLKTKPRGYRIDHPRIELLRHRSLTVDHDYGFDPIIHSRALVDAVRDDWRRTRGLVDWLADRLRD